MAMKDIDIVSKLGLHGHHVHLPFSKLVNLFDGNNLVEIESIPFDMPLTPVVQRLSCGCYEILQHPVFVYACLGKPWPSRMKAFHIDKKFYSAKQFQSIVRLIYYWSGACLSKAGVKPLVQAIYSDGDLLQEFNRAFSPEKVWADLRLPGILDDRISSATVNRIKSQCRTVS